MACFACSVVFYEYDTLWISVAFAIISLTGVGFMIFKIHTGRAGPGAVRALTVLATVPVMILAGTLRASESANAGNNVNHSFLNSKCSFAGVVTDVSVKSSGKEYEIKPFEITIEETGEIVTGLDGLLVSFSTALADQTDFSCGDNVKGSGRITTFAPPPNPGCFDEKSYYAVRGLDARVRPVDLSGLNDEALNTYELGRFEKILLSLKKVTTDMKCDLSAAVLKALPPRDAGVIISILTGERGMLDADTKDALSEGGIAHILAVSGLHISLISEALRRLLLQITGSIRISCVVTIVVLVLYGLFTGFPVSALRAILMSCVLLVGRILGRTYDSVSAAAFSALAIIFYEPRYLFDTSFLMSFSAAAGSAYGSEICAGARIRNERARSAVRILSIWIFMLPVLMSSYCFIALYSIVANLVVLPLMSLLVPMGAACAVTGMVGLEFVSKFLAGTCHYIISFFLFVCECSAKLPFSQIITGVPDAKAMILFYAAMALTLVFVTTQRKKRYLALLLLCAVIFIKPAQTGMQTDMLDVGQGECIVITGGGKTYMIDGGSSDIKKVYKYRIEPYLKYRGISHIDKIFLSHPDTDHKNGLIELFADPVIDADELVVSRFVAEDTDVVCAAREAGAGVIYAERGDKFTLFDDATVTVVSPLNEADAKEMGGVTYADSNASSLVLELSYSGFDALFTGDSDDYAEKRYIPYLGCEDYELLKIAHHGSRYSTSGVLLERTLPIIGIVSCSATNRYGHPAAETMERLLAADVTTYVTAYNHCISIKIDKNGVKLTLPCDAQSGTG